MYKKKLKREEKLTNIQCLCVGVSDYSIFPRLKNLPSAAHDSRSIFSKYKERGWDVIFLENPSGQDLEDAIDNFDKRLQMVRV